MAPNNRIVMSIVHISIICILISTSAGQDEHCPSFCRFRFCHNLLRDGIQPHNENRGVTLSFPYSPENPFPCIVREGGAQELRNVTGGEARVSRRFEDKFVPISKFMSSEVKPNFSKKQIRWIMNEENNRSSLTRIRSKGNQEEHLFRLCVQMPITSYVRRDGTRKRTRGKSACVGFRSFTHKLLVEFRWDSTNDFDLRLQEPNGFEINRFGANFISPVTGGLFKGDAGSQTCQNELANERIVYRHKRSVVERGIYTIRVDHHRRCELRTNYKLRVLHQGKRIHDEMGLIDSDIQPNIIIRSFTI